MQSTAVTRLNVWCGPRNVSTAVMYSFRQRADTRVVDEPLYGHYLATTGAGHPGATDVIGAMSTDAQDVIERVILGPVDRRVLMCKQMAHHLIPSVPAGFLASCTNTLLVRDPVDVLTTIVRQLPEPTMQDIGIERQVRLLHELLEIGQEPVVVDSAELLRDPEGVLRQWCSAIGIPWDPSMLAWPAGPKPEDGVWAEHWYQRAHESTGFVPYAPKTEPLPDRLRTLADEATSHYQTLAAVALRARTES